MPPYYIGFEHLLFYIEAKEEESGSAINHVAL